MSEFTARILKAAQQEEFHPKLGCLRTKSIVFILFTKDDEDNKYIHDEQEFHINKVLTTNYSVSEELHNFIKNWPTDCIDVIPIKEEFRNERIITRF